MGEGKGWICLHRNLLNNELWDDRPYAMGQAWVDLLLLANHEDKKTIYQGQFVEFKRGTVNRSIASLADRWGWDRKKVRKYLNLLETEEMVITKSTTHGTTITIVNYGVFQDLGTTKRPTKRTSTPQQKDNHSPQTTMNNNDNNENNINTSSVKHKYGEYKNVLLTDEQLETLKKEFPSDWQERIEELSESIAVHGYKYTNFLATIRNWAKSPKKKGDKNNVDQSQRNEYYSTSDIYGYN